VSYDAAAHVSSPLGEAETALARKSFQPLQEIRGWKMPELSQRDRQPFRTDGPSLPRSLGIAGNVYESLDVGRSKRLGDESCRIRGQAPAPLLLPGTDERARALVVDDRRPGACECEATA